MAPEGIFGKPQHWAERVGNTIWELMDYQFVKQMAIQMMSYPDPEVPEMDIADTARLEFFATFLEKYVLPQFALERYQAKNGWAVASVLLALAKQEAV